MKQNSRKHRFYSFKCFICSRVCQYYYCGAKCCDACKQFFRRSILSMREYKCKNNDQCQVTKGSKCKRCRLKKCFSVGMNPRAVYPNCNNDEQIMAFAQRVQTQTKKTGKRKPKKGLAAEPEKPTISSSSSSLAVAAKVATKMVASTSGRRNSRAKPKEPNTRLAQKNMESFILLNCLLETEAKVCRIRDSPAQIPEFFFNHCDTFEAIFERKLNLLDFPANFVNKLACPLSKTLNESISQMGPVNKARPLYLAMDLLLVFEIGKTFSFFERLQTKDKIALCSNIAMPLFILCSGFYSVQQNCETLCFPSAVTPLKRFSESFYKEDSMSSAPINRLKLKTEEFVLVRAIIYSHMVSPGLSDEAQQLLYSEAEKFSSLLMNFLQTNYGPEAGVRRYVEMMALIEFVFNSGAKHRQMLTYISNVVDPHFDIVMPPVLAKVCTIGPVELHQLLPIRQ